jgi:hypothetical protein
LRSGAIVAAAVAASASTPSYYIDQLERGPAKIVAATLARNTESLAEAIVLLRFGIDGRKLARFEALTPNGVEEENGRYVFEERKTALRSSCVRPRPCCARAPRAS